MINMELRAFKASNFVFLLKFHQADWALGSAQLFLKTMESSVKVEWLSMPIRIVVWFWPLLRFFEIINGFAQKIDQSASDYFLIQLWELGLHFLFNQRHFFLCILFDIFKSLISQIFLIVKFKDDSIFGGSNWDDFINQVKSWIWILYHVFDFDQHIFNGL